MNARWQSLTALGLCLGLIGCVKTHTRIVEMPRVDQELQAGNRGYLVGQAPKAEPPRRMTRKVIMTDVELPTREELKPVKADVGPGNRGYTIREEKPAAMTAPAAPMTAAQPIAPRPAPEPLFDELPPIEPVTPRAIAPVESSSPVAATYKVKGGDTLEKIAKQFYGEAAQWPRIYKANQETLKNPNRLYPGQTLTIPEGSQETQRADRPESMK